MLSNWNRWMWISGLPFFYFIVLLLISFFFFNLFFRRVVPKVASGSAVMALGIFALTCLPKFDLPLIMRIIVATELLIIWLFLVTMLMQAFLQDSINMSRYANRFAVGTWVSGTILISLLLDQIESTLLGFIILLGIIAFIIWLFYLVIILKWLLICIRKKFRVFANGMVLLGTVATQAIALILIEFFHEDIPIWIYQAIILFGYVLYFVGLYVIIRHLLYAHKRHLIVAWPNVNCICYGAIAITGLAILNASIFPDWLMIGTWWLTIICFVCVELIEIARLILRVKIKGIKRGIFVYDTSQWSRIFTLGMIYAFTLTLYHKHQFKNVLLPVIANYGQFVVTAFLLMELILFSKILSTNI